MLTILALAVALDIGGPCVDEPKAKFPGQYEIEKAKDWSRLVELEKKVVRAGCSNPHRWLGLARALVKAGRNAEAAAALGAAHERGYELRRDQLDPVIHPLLSSSEFLSSTAGKDWMRLNREAERRQQEHAKGLAALARRPPARLVAKDSCPGECCRLGTWRATKAVALYEAPGSAKIVGRVAEGQPVEALEGESHLEPVPVAVLHDSTPFAKGEIVFLLDYIGEGYSNFWRDGVEVQGDLTPAPSCVRAGPQCASEYVGRPLKPGGDWWVKFRLKNGVVGWSNEGTAGFDGTHGCG